MKSDPIPRERLMKAIVLLLDLEPDEINYVKTVMVGPQSVTVETYAVNEEGQKFVGESNRVATHFIRREVS